ncbi:MAG: hypothetical protein HYY02_01780 [Chloroflexi bacterium]|nr:hypothetical protein [Chloroflexota bacterium]
MHEPRPHHIDPRPHLPETPQALTVDLLGRFSRQGISGPLVVSGILLLVGLVGFLMRLGGGFAQREVWGYYAATFVWVLSTAQAAPIIAVATRLTKGYWRKPMIRAAELWTVAGILNLLLLLPLLALIPPLEGRRTFWVNWQGAPQVVVLLGMIGLVACGLGFLYTSALPDLGAARDKATGGPRGLIAALARSWAGTPHQWKIMRTGITYLGIFYLMMLVFMHFLVSVEYAITLVPGWRDPVFPAFHAISSLQAGLATIILTLGLYRAFGGYRQYLALDQFWNPAKLLMSFSLLWFYFWWSGFIVFWYGRTPAETGVLQAVIFGPYLLPFVIGFICNFVAPVGLLIWNPIRTSIKGPIFVSLIVLVGNFFDRLRIYGGSFLVEPFGHEVEHVPPAHLPELADFLVIFGAVGGVVFLYLLAMRIFPPVSLWELKENQILTRARSLVRAQVVVIGKPE